MNQPYNPFQDWLKQIQTQQQTQNSLQTPLDIYQQWFDMWSKGMQQGTSDSAFIHQMFDTGKSWMRAVQTMFDNFAPQRKEASIFGEWSQMYSTWMHNLGKPFGNKPVTSSNTHLFDNLVSTSQAYMKMFELWQPTMEQFSQMSSSKRGMEFFMQNVDQQKYKQVVEIVFGMLSPQPRMDFLEQTQQFTQQLLGQINLQMEGRLNKLIENTPELFQSTQQTGYEILHKMQKSIAPVLTMMPASKEKQILEITMKIQDKYARYYVKASQMQTMINATAQQAMEVVAKTMLERSAGKNSQLPSFDEFFNRWMDTTEPMMIELYRSDGFSQLQAEVMSISSAIKMDFEKQLEILLEPLPIAPRSELDQLNGVIHELKSRLRHLEKELKQRSEVIEIEQKPEKTAPKEEATVKAPRKTKASNS